MLKIICTFMVLIITLAVLCSNSVESRSVLQSFGGIPSTGLHYVRFGKNPIDNENSNEDDREEYIHTKRKSELLSSLYALPYELVNKRNAN